MADDTFSVGLQDKASGPAKTLAATLRAVRDAATAAGRAVTQLSDDLSAIKPIKSTLAPLTSASGPLAPVADSIAPRRKKGKASAPGDPLATVTGAPDSPVAPLEPLGNKSRGTKKKAKVDASPAAPAATEDTFSPVFKGMTAPKSAGKLVQGIFGVINKVGSFGNSIQNKFGDEIGGFALQAMSEKAKEGTKNLVFKTAGGLLSGLGSLVTAPFTIAASATQMLGTVIMAGVGAAVAFTAAVGGLAVSLVKMSFDAQIAQDSLDALSIGLDAGPISKAARDITDQTGAMADKVTRSLAKLSRAGWSTKLSKDIAQGMSDLDLTISQGSGDILAKGISDISNKQAGGYESLKEMFGGKDSAGAKQLDKNLADILRLNTNQKPEALKAQIEAAITAGKLSKDDAVKAALSAVSASTKLDIGGATEWFTNNKMAGALQALQGAWNNLMGDVAKGDKSVAVLRDLRGALDKNSESGKAIRDIFKAITGTFDEIAGKVDVKGIITDITKAFAPGTESGKKFQEILSKVGQIFDKLMGSGKKGGFTLTDGIEIGIFVLGKVVDVALFAASVFETVGPKIKKFFKEMGGGDVGKGGADWLTKALINPLDAITSLVGPMLEAVGQAIGDKLNELFGSIDLSSAGSDLMTGLWDGIQAGFASFIGQFEGLIGLLPASVKSILGIHSPSKVFADLGVHTMAGFEVGIDKGAAGVEGAVADGVSPDVTPPRFERPGAASTSASTSGHTFGDVVINMTATSGDPKQIAKETYQRFIDELEGMGAEMGLGKSFG